jgi:hypothetical protein
MAYSHQNINKDNHYFGILSTKSAHKTEFLWKKSKKYLDSLLLESRPKTSETRKLT